MLFRSKFLTVFVVVLVLFVAIGVTGAQDESPLPSQLIVQISATLETPPIIEPLDDNTAVFQVMPTGTVSGDLVGSFVQDITQISPLADGAPNEVQPITAFFTIETDAGTLRGFYVGAFFPTDDSFPDVHIKAHGQILSVTAAYADLYLADVYYDGVVDFEEIDGELIPLGDGGPMVIAPR